MLWMGLPKASSSAIDGLHHQLVSWQGRPGQAKGHSVAMDHGAGGRARALGSGVRALIVLVSSCVWRRASTSTRMAG